MAARPISSASTPGKAATGCLVAFFAVFALIGGGAFFAVFVRPMTELLAARSWRPTSCVILESRVGESTDSDGTTYRVEVLYSYTVDGRSYQSQRYGFDSWYSGGREPKQEIVAGLSPGTQTTCWVDPADPGRAVLSRAFSPRYLVGLVPLLFFAVGAGGIAFVLRAARKAPAGASASRPLSPFGVSLPDGQGTAPLELRPTATPAGKFVGLTFVALFWNGIVSVFVVVDVKEWRGGAPNGCMTVFLVPFVAVGFLLIYGAIRQFLILFNPRVHVRMSPGTPAAGAIVVVEWRLSGRGGGVRRLCIVLEGREEARYRRGTSTYTDRNVFARVPVVDTTQTFEIPAGSARFDLPAAALPSFQAAHNKIVWSLKVACEIPGWPDSDDEYEVTVIPGGAAWGELS
jgi:uncharacterized protein DUF3592